MASSNGTVARVVLQQCLSARLQVQPAAETEEAKFVQIERGMVIYVCFLKGATQETVDKMVKTILTARLSEEDATGKYVSVLDLPGNVLVVPQATLGGRLKGKMFQYHNNIDKTAGQELYHAFVAQCKDTMDKNAKSQERGCVVHHGTYGNRQVLALDTNGPFSHNLEF